MKFAAGWKGLGRGVLAALIVGTTALSLIPMARAGTEAPANTATVDAEAPDTVILKSGTTVRGKILKEDERTITIMIVIKGMKAQTTYNKSEVLEVKRGISPATRAEAMPAFEKPALLEPKKEEPKAAEPEDSKQTRLYVLELKGRFGSEVAATPIRRAFEEADKYFSDLIPGTGDMTGKMVVDPSKRERNIVVLKMDTNAAQGDDIFTSEDKAPVVKEQMIGKNRRVVFWIEKALGGAAMLPWISPEIYFTPAGKLGGARDLDAFNMGDKMVNEKQVSLRMGHAHGFAIKGGHGEHIPVINAMFRTQYWLCVKFEGGRPVYLDRKPDPAKDGEGWVILSDDGDGENKDDKDALEGNDLFTLEADWAMKLGIARGLAETVDDLAFQLGVQRNYKEVEEKANKGRRALEEWKTKIKEAGDLIRPREMEDKPVGKLWKQLAEVEVNGDFNNRKRARGRQLGILTQVRALVQQYKEVVDTDGQWTADIDVQINRVKLEAEQDAKNERRAPG